MDIETLRKLCGSYPGVTEDIKWGADLCFLVGSKMFCVTGMENGSHTSFKVTPEEFDELIDRPGIIPAPYMARNKWVAVTDGSALKMEEWKHFLKQSYELVKAGLPAKVRNSLGQ